MIIVVGKHTTVHRASLKSKEFIFLDFREIHIPEDTLGNFLEQVLRNNLACKINRHLQQVALQSTERKRHRRHAPKGRFASTGNRPRI